MFILLVRRDKPAGCLRMAVLHGEGLATCAGLESCVGVRTLTDDCDKGLVAVRAGDGVRGAFFTKIIHGG
jgi:hypothetical protein